MSVQLFGTEMHLPSRPPVRWNGFRLTDFVIYAYFVTMQDPEFTTDLTGFDLDWLALDVGVSTREAWESIDRLIQGSLLEPDSDLREFYAEFDLRTLRPVLPDLDEVCDPDDEDEEI